MPDDDDVELNPGAGGKIVRAEIIDGKEYQVVKVALGGRNVDLGDLGDVPLPVVAESLPLPDGASSASLQDATNAALAAILEALLAAVGLTDTELRASPVPVSVVGVATEAKQDAGNASLATIASALADPLAVTGMFWQATQPVSGTVAVTGTFFQATQPVSGTFWQATQPVSGTVAVSSLPGGLATDAGLLSIYTRLANGEAHVVVDSGTLAVTGTFWQATQPVSIAGTVTTTALTDTQLRASAVPVSLSTLPALVAGTAVIGHIIVDSGSITTGGLTDAQLRATALPVSGTFWQATQPVSGTFWQATQPVSGTFWQATQPVSGTVAFSNTTIAVTGTFWQATQPVSGTVTATGPLTDTQLRASAVPVSLATLPSLAAGSAVIGHVIVDSIVATVTPAAPTVVKSGQVTMTGSAVALTTTSSVSSVIVQALSTNGASIWVGPSGVTTGTGFELQPGQATSIAIADLTSVYVIGTSGDKACYLGS